MVIITLAVWLSLTPEPDPNVGVVPILTDAQLGSEIGFAPAASLAQYKLPAPPPLEPEEYDNVSPLPEPESTCTKRCHDCPFPPIVAVSLVHTIVFGMA